MAGVDGKSTAKIWDVSEDVAGAVATLCRLRAWTKEHSYLASELGSRYC